MVAVPQPYDIVITSNSGYPLDLNIYQSVKGMSAAGQIVKSGGSIIIASECWDGIPEGSDYEKILASVHSPRELNAYIRQNELHHQDTWQVFLQSVIQQKADVYLYSDRLSDDQIRMALLQPTRDIPRLVDALVDRYGHDSSICIMPEGPHTIPYVQTG
jgi:nickel-dependent lactate racemase